MIVVAKGESITKIMLADGRSVFLTKKEMRQATDHRARGPGQLADIVQVMVDVAAEDEQDRSRVYTAVTMAVRGEFGALARQLELWGIEATR